MRKILVLILFVFLFFPLGLKGDIAGNKVEGNKIDKKLLNTPSKVILFDKKIDIVKPLLTPKKIRQNSGRVDFKRS
ncbi:hypothetical protein [Thermotomaculum hydrothermale]|uniref:hypothetical protein n=1 Tax=Thermotomaculum hydrothermale TaxID=981385 RepID=UPI0019166A62|nr:hypothetical protein [Thermotomaculum hydrothermale]